MKRRRTRATHSPLHLSWAIAVGLFCLCLALYVSRMAPSVVPGDPGEYQLIAARWGIGHPPGYGFYALLGNLFTHLLPLGAFAWRANLLSAVCGATIVALVYGIGRTLPATRCPPSVSRGLVESSDQSPTQTWEPTFRRAAVGQVPSIVGALALATGIDLWQHAIHANAHIVTALLATFSVFCLLRWWHTKADRWLFLFCTIAGLSPVQHPLLVFAFPAYALFVWTVRPGILRDVRTLLRASGFALLGLMFYLYYPIRCAIGAPPPPGPSDMHTWAGFVRVVTAQGLRGNLLGFTLREILQRLWDVRVPLRLQYPLPGLLLAAVGFVRLWIRRWRPALLLTTHLSCMVLVTVNVLQDEMAYLLGPMVVVGVLIGAGAGAVMELVSRLSPRPARTPHADVAQAASYRLLPLASCLLLLASCLLLLASCLLPIWSLVVNWVRMDLSDFQDADAWLEGVEARFVGQGQGAALLSEWERMTTVYYYAAVEGRGWDERDLRFVPISAGTEMPFLKAVDDNLPRGPVYLNTYRPQVARTPHADVAGPHGTWGVSYRLMPSGDLWQALPAWPRELPAEAHPTRRPTQTWPTQTWGVAQGPDMGAAIEILGWRLDKEQAGPGDVLVLDLYMRMSNAEQLEAYYLPWARLGETTYRFTTDSRFNTPLWQPGEIVVERFELPVPWADTLHPKDKAGRYPLQVGMRQVSEGRDLELDGGPRQTRGRPTSTTLTEVTIERAAWKPSERKLEQALGNLRGEILLRGARINGRRVRPAGQAGSDAHADVGPRFVLRPGRTLRVVLEWESLRPIEENYKVFVQLLDAGLQVRAQGDDKAPLGGSAPTLLWFPRWRRGTRVTDTYLLDVPPDLPPGPYPLVVGMYGFSTFKRVQVVSPDGNMEGDWVTLAHLWVD